MVDGERSEEYKYLADMSIVPEIPEFIQERYDEVEKIFVTYLHNSNASEDVIGRETNLLRII